VPRSLPSVLRLLAEPEVKRDRPRSDTCRPSDRPPSAHISSLPPSQKRAHQFLAPLTLARPVRVHQQVQALPSRQHSPHTTRSRTNPGKKRESARNGKTKTRETKPQSGLAQQGVDLRKKERYYLLEGRVRDDEEGQDKEGSQVAVDDGGDPGVEGVEGLGNVDGKLEDARPVELLLAVEHVEERAARAVP
jgi:hypothetical protein